MEIESNNMEEELNFDGLSSLRTFVESDSATQIDVEDLIFDLGDFKLTDEVVGLVGKVMLRIQNVQNLHLNLFASRCSTTQTTKLFSGVMSKDRNLKKVAIDLSENGFTGEVVSTLWGLLGFNSSSLVRFTLNISRCSKLNLKKIANWPGEEQIKFPKLKFINIDMEESRLPKSVLQNFIWKLTLDPVCTPELMTVKLNCSSTKIGNSRKYIAPKVFEHTHA